MNLFHCSSHDFYWMHLFHISCNTSCTLPPRPLSRKNRINLLGITVVPREIQGKAKLMQNWRGGGGGGGWTRCIMGNVQIVNSKLLGGAMPLDVTWDQPNFYKTEKKSMYKERTLLNLSTCVSHNARMAWFVLCGLSSQIAFGRRGSLSVDQQARFTKKGSLACSFRWDKAIEWYMDTREGWCS